MRPAINTGIVLTGGDPRTAAELAAEAEAAGWDGVFTWDGIAVGAMDTYDPWVVMAAIAMRTSRVRIGAVLTPPARRRPWKLAREAMSLDRLSDGRLVLPVGLGATDDRGFGNVGEPTDARTRAERLDEALDILVGLWTGQPFAYEGRHHRFGEMTFRPTPVQRPRIPIWPVGAWPNDRSMRRTLRWDGVLVQAEMTPSTIRAIAEYGARERPPAMQASPWDIVAGGTTPADDRANAVDTVAALAAEGATWWIEQDWEHGTVDQLRRRIGAGPPRD